MNPLVASVIRTYTPIIAGQIGAWLIMVNIPVLPELTVLLTALVGGGLSLAYYTLVRVLEQQWPAFGLLLGLPSSPDTYSKGEPAPVAVPAAVVPEAPAVEVAAAPAPEPVPFGTAVAPEAVPVPTI